MAQDTGLPVNPGSVESPSTASVPSLESKTNGNLAPALQPRKLGGAPALPTDGGQYWEEYDLTPYTKELQVDRPQRAIVDWILRDTGTDVWFTEPFGILSADRSKLRVYHNAQMHQLVRGIYEQFVNGTVAPQSYGLRVMAVGNPNWRTRAHSLMRTVQAQSPGVQAYLLHKENSAILLAMLRGRADFRELAATELIVHNGQSQELEQVRGRNYVQDLQPAEGQWPPYMPVTADIKEGYRMQLSPLLSVDRRTVDLVVKCDIDQLEKVSNVSLDLPLPTGQFYTGMISVPQVASWRLHERFRWPADQVLLLSCGVVAAPQGGTNNSLLGQGSGLLGLDRILSPGGERADALLMIEHRGDATNQTSSSSALQTTGLNTRGRY